MGRVAGESHREAIGKPLRPTTPAKPGNISNRWASYKMIGGRGDNMKFVLAGFHQNGNVRRYSFQGIGDDRRTRIEFSVGVDLTLLYKHRIPLQEAPFCAAFCYPRGSGALSFTIRFPPVAPFP